MRFRYSLFAGSLVIGATLGCATHPMGPQYDGVCSIGQDKLAFRVHNVDTDRIGYVDGVEGIEALAYHLDVDVAGVERSGGGDLLYCAGEDGCDVGYDPGAVDEGWFRYDGFYLDDDGAQVRFVLEGVQETKSALSGTCFHQTFGVFDAERTQSEYWDGSADDKD